MVTVNAIGDACPLPVVKTINAIKTLTGADTVETLVDNETAVENLKRLGKTKGYEVTVEKQAENRFRVLLQVKEGAEAPDEAEVSCPVSPVKNRVVVIPAGHMGEGDEKLGKTLIKGFIFALGQLEELPKTVLFYNGGAFLTCEGSDSLADLKSLEERGVEILTCGTCLNYYGLTEKLAVGGVTNMYSIVEKMAGADLIIKP